MFFCTRCPKSAVWGSNTKYFPKIPSEMNSTHPFYTILIPNTPYLKSLFFVILFAGGSDLPFHFFVLGVQKVLWDGVSLDMKLKFKKKLYLHIISTRVCKKIFLIKAKSFFVLGVPKVLWEGVNIFQPFFKKWAPHTGAYACTGPTSHSPATKRCQEEVPYGGREGYDFFNRKFF